MPLLKPESRSWGSREMAALEIVCSYHFREKKDSKAITFCYTSHYELKKPEKWREFDHTQTRDNF